MEECHYKSCDKEANYELRYSEPGTDVNYKYACTEHKNTERIHDPHNVTVSETLDDRSVEEMLRDALSEDN